MEKLRWWLLLLTLVVLVVSMEHLMLAFEWFDDDTDVEKVEDKGVVDKAKQTAQQVKEKVEDVGKKATSTLSQTYQQNIAQPIREWMRHDTDFHPIHNPFLVPPSWWPSMPSSPEERSFATHAVANWGSFKTFPNEYIAYLDLPGIPKEEIRVVCRGRRLSIAGTHGTCLRGPENTVDRFCLERKVERVFSIPDDVLIEHIEAALKDGVLFIKLPRMEEEEEEADEEAGTDIEGTKGAWLFGRKKEAKGGKRLRGRRIAVKDYKPTWKERSEHVMESMGFKKEKKY